MTFPFPKRRRHRRAVAFTFSMEHIIESTLRVWARAPNSFAVSIVTFASWLQVPPSDHPRFHEHQVVIDSETKQPVYLNMYAAANWCKHVIRHDQAAAGMADLIHQKILKIIQHKDYVRIAILNDVSESIENDNLEDVAKTMVNIIGELLDDHITSDSKRIHIIDMIKDRLRLSL